MTSHEDDFDEDLLRDLPIEIWTESDIGQALLDLARRGKCRHVRLNATLGRFEHNIDGDRAHD